MTYLLFYLYLGIASLIGRSKISYFILTVPMFILIFGFRYRIGFDWDAYQQTFQRIEFYNFKEGTLPIGFALLNKLIYYIEPQFQLLILIVFIFMLVSFFVNIKYFTPNYTIGILAWMGVNFFAFGILKQVIAISIMFYAIRYIKDNKKVYYILVAIATLFHPSAIVLILLPFFVNKNYSNKQIISALVLSFIVFVFDLFRPVLELLVKLPIIGQKIGFYLMDQGTLGATLGLEIRFFEGIILFILCSYYKETLINKFKYFPLFYNLLFGYLVLFLLLNHEASLVARFTKYFEFSHIILFSYLPTIIRDKNIKLISVLGLFTYFGIRFWILINDGTTIFLPYSNMLIPGW